MKAAVVGGGMRDDAIRIKPRMLRGSPWGLGVGLDVAADKAGELPAMLGPLLDVSAKTRLAIDETAEAVEVLSRPALRGRLQAGGIGDAKTSILGGKGKEGEVGDAGGQSSLTGAMERGLGGLRGHDASP